MGKCPSCGNSSFWVSTRKCAGCGKVVCNRCVLTSHGSFAFKKSLEDSSAQRAKYETVGFCSDECFNQFWQKVISYPAENFVGTDIDNFDKNWVRYWNDSIVNALLTSANTELATKAKKAREVHTERFVAFPWLDISNQPIWMAQKSSYNAKLALAQNLERCGRIMDSAKVFEELRLYDKARELREKERHIVIKKTDVSVNLNALLQQVKDSGLVAVYRCPHCGGNLKIGKSTNLESLRKCDYCGSEIEIMDLADFLRTVLS